MAETRKRTIPTGIWVLVILLMLTSAAYGGWKYFMSRQYGHTAQYTKANYTDDDGRTVFSDDLYRVSPFDHGGKIAVSAMVFRYDGGKKELVGYLRRFNPQWKKLLDDKIAAAARQGLGPSTLSEFHNSDLGDGVEVKLPGEGHNWVPLRSEEGKKIAVTPPSPDSSPIILDMTPQ